MRLVLVLAAGLGPAGCSLSGGSHARATRAPAPASTSAPAAATETARAAPGVVAAKITRADRTHEVPTPAPAQRVAGGWRTPAQAIRVFATRYINWDASDVTADLHALARVSIGQARSAMTQAASGTGADDELRQGGVANAGEVESIAAVVGHRREYAVVTRERTTATATSAYRGLAPAWHLALATVSRVPGRLWVLSGWQPES
jgi:hypothetical protein